MPLGRVDRLSNEVFRGRLDAPSNADQGDTASIQITYENLLVDLFRERALRYTTAQQDLFFPGDKGFDYADFVAEASVVWGGES